MAAVVEHPVLAADNFHTVKHHGNSNIPVHTRNTRNTPRVHPAAMVYGKAPRVAMGFDLRVVPPVHMVCVDRLREMVHPAVMVWEVYHAQAAHPVRMVWEVHRAVTGVNFAFEHPTLILHRLRTDRRSNILGDVIILDGHIGNIWEHDMNVQIKKYNILTQSFYYINLCFRLVTQLYCHYCKRHVWMYDVCIENDETLWSVICWSVICEKPFRRKSTGPGAIN